tara:strand:+ start:32 stop:472 length:441 start_codon:yes stop_codon:yes gene_type:complete
VGEMTEQLNLFQLEEYNLRDDEGKTCSKCDTHLPLDKFSFSSGANFLRPECKKCNNKLTKIRNRLRKKYGMPTDGYVCPICNGDEQAVSGKGGSRNGAWVIDHCHSTDTFRGWLCHTCNRCLGGFDDNQSILERAILYLKKHKESL